MVTELAEDKQKEEVVHNVKDKILFPGKWKNCFIFSFSGRLRSGRGGVDKVRREEEVNLFCFLFYLECTCVSSNAVLSHFDIVQVLSVCEKVLSRLLLSSIKLPAEVDCCQCRSRSRTN